MRCPSGLVLLSLRCARLTPLSVAGARTWVGADTRPWSTAAAALSALPRLRLAVRLVAGPVYERLVASAISVPVGAEFLILGLRRALRRRIPAGAAARLSRKTALIGA